MQKEKNMIIFEGEELILHYHEGDSDYIIISFVGAGHSHEAQKSFFLKPIVEKYNISCLGITCKSDNYYLHENIKEIITLCNEISLKYKKVILIGVCMAGYAALKYSKLLNADIVFAMSPACTIDQKILPIHQVAINLLTRVNEKTIKQSTLKQNDFQGKLYVVHDPTIPSNNIDALQIDFLKTIAPQAVYIPVFFLGMLLFMI